MKKISVIIIVILVCIMSFGIIYGAINKDKEEIKEDIVILENVTESTTEDTTYKGSISTYDGNANVDGGGSNDGTQDGDGKGYNITDSVKDESIRATLVDSKTGIQVTTPMDFANNPREPVKMHFGKVTKLSYLKESKLNMVATKYDVKTVPKEIKIPKIIGGSTPEIKDFFRNSKFSNYFTKETGFNYEEMISGKYKLLIEPLGFPIINGVITACTSTELVMYDDILKGKILRSWIMNFSHDNLTLSMFLEKTDLGIRYWSGRTTGKQKNSHIRLFLGVGII